jgi:hypothetical protein
MRRLTRPVTRDSGERSEPDDARQFAARIARHPAAWRFLLPRQPDGPVVLADLEPVTTGNLLRSYPQALVLARAVPESGAGNAVVWDGSHLPLLAGRAGLVVCDDRLRSCAAALAPVVAPSGQHVAIVSSGQPYRFALFPTPEQLRAVVAPGWPLTFDGPPRKWLGYWLATSVAWRYLDRAGLAMSRPRGSVVDLVLDQLSAALSGAAELRGLIAGRGLGQATLRVRCAGAELAVRVAVSPGSARRLANHQSAVTEIAARLGPGQRRLAFPDIVTAGTADGVAWAAERWISAPAVRSSRRWRPAGSGWAALQDIAGLLAASAPTGHAGPGWARGWLAGLDAVAPGLVDEVLAGLTPIEAAGLPTAWCHGDLWPGNVFLRRGSLPPVVIDWERARPDAPGGLDGLYAETCRISVTRRCTFGEAAARLARSAPDAIPLADIGGRNFAAWSQAERYALLLALATHYATGENEDDRADTWTRSWAEMHVMPMLRVLRESR